MTSKIFFIFQVLASCIVCMQIYGQETLRGRVFNATDSSSLERASIVLIDAENNKILKFGFTDKEGRFNLNISQKNKIILKSTYLGFEPYLDTLFQLSEFKSIYLNPSETTLREVNIKPRGITQYSDTLSYSVNTFKSPNDRMLADLLKRLPGVSVTEDGKIYYQGKAINKFYVEGLNLLDGRYNLITQNMPLDAVSQVRVYEQHQPIKALKSIEFSDKAAIDIKLKNNVSFTGHAQAGISQNLKWADVNISPMMFSKKIQFLNLNAFNNSGQDISNQLKSFDITEALLGQKGGNLNPSFLSTLRIPLAGLKDDHFLFNKTFVESLNILKKLKNDFQVRLNLNFYSDQNQSNYSNSTQYFVPGDKNYILFSKQLNLKKIQNGDAKIDLEKNTNSFFLKESFSYNNLTENSQGQSFDSISTNSLSVLKLKYHEFRNTFHLLFPLKNKNKIQLYSLIYGLKNDQSLYNSPIPTFLRPDSSILYNSITQYYANPQTVLINTVQFHASNKNFDSQNKFSWLYKKQELNSQLNNQNNLQNAYINAIPWNENKLEYSFDLSKKTKNKLRFFTNLSFNYYDFKYSQNKNIEKFTFEPSLSISNDNNNKLTFNFNSNLNYNFGEIQSIYDQYILKSYSILTKNNNELNFSKNWSNYLSLAYKNVLNYFFINASVNYSRNKNNIISGTDFTQDGNLEKYNKSLENKTQNWMVNANISKYFFDSKINLKFTSNLNSNKQYQILENDFSRLNAKSYGNNVFISKVFSDKFSIDYTMDLNLSTQKTSSSTSEFKFTSFINSLNVNVKIIKGIGLKFNSSLNQNKAIEKQKNQFFLSDLALIIPTKNKKINFDLNWMNIFNAKQYILVESGSSIQTISSVPLRHSQLMFLFNYSF